LEPRYNCACYNWKSIHIDALGKLYTINIGLKEGVKHKMFGTQDIILITVIVVVLFGATRLPQIGSGIGQAIKNFKKGVSEIEEETNVTPKKDSSKKEEKSEIED